MDNFDVLWEFAEDSTEAVSLVASNLAAEKARSGWYITFRPAERPAGRYLGTLAVNLREINGFLKQPTRLEDIGEKLEELLAELERVCDVRPPTLERRSIRTARGTVFICISTEGRLLIDAFLLVVERRKVAYTIVERNR